MSLFIAVVLMSAQAAADPQPVAAPSAETPAEAPKKAKEKRICKSDEADPGSHMTKRTCRTEQEWAQQRMLGSSRSGVSISGDAMQDH
jgi:hypothetical protein